MNKVGFCSDASKKPDNFAIHNEITEKQGWKEHQEATYSIPLPQGRVTCIVQTDVCLTTQLKAFTTPPGSLSQRGTVSAHGKCFLTSKLNLRAAPDALSFLP